MKDKIKPSTSSSTRVYNDTLRRVKSFTALKGMSMLDYVSGVLEKEMDRQDKIKQKKSGLPF